MNKIKELLCFNLRLLFLRTTPEEFKSFANSHLVWGLICTWLVGIGRWWDDPGARLIQHLGLGSLIYIFVLAAILWLFIDTLKPQAWSYKHVLTFLSLTSLPAIIYAIPVERFLPIETAIQINIWFLGIVASWRIILLAFYLLRHAGLHWFKTLVATLLPICLIAWSLTLLNLHRVVFDIMGGLRQDPSVTRIGLSETNILHILTLFATFALIPLIIAYFTILIVNRKR